MKKKLTKKQHQRLKNQQTVDMLNELIKVRLGASDVHGVGVFALRDIKKGERLYADALPEALDLPYKDFKKLRPEISKLILERWPNIVTGSMFIYPDTRIQAFMNHQDKPNYDAKKDIMLKKAKAGDEIYEDYRQIDNWEKIFGFLKKA